MCIWRTQEATMKSSTAQSMQVFYMSLLCLLTLHIATGNDIVDSTTETGADIRVATGLPAAREGIYSFSRKINREISIKEQEDAPGRRRKREANPPAGSLKKVFYCKADNVTVVLLVFFLIFIILALVFFYKRLNRESHGEYALPKLINGARELVQNAARPVESRLRELLMSRRASGDEELGEEDDEEQSGEKESEKDAESLAEYEQRGEDSSDDYSSMEGFDPQEGKTLQGRSEKGREGKRVSQEKKEKKKGEVTDEEKEEEEKKEVEGDENRQGGQSGEGLLADLKEFSGSAIWAEEKNEGEKNSCDLTEL